VSSFSDVCGVLSIGFSVLSGAPYLYSIIKGKTKPHQLTWIVYTIVNGVVVVSQYLEGARNSVLISEFYFVYCAIVVFLSIKYGVRNTSKYDRILFAMSIATLVVWAFTKNNDLAIWLTAVIDTLATAMLMLKVHLHPKSEALTPWITGTVAYVFSCLSLAGRPLGILYVRPTYGLLCDLAIALSVFIYGVKRSDKQGPGLPPAGI
jgi:hypothetical protein